MTHPVITAILALAIAGASGHVSSADRSFAQSALRDNAAEISRAAIQADSTDSRVREFAGRMTTDHTFSERQLAAIAGPKGIDTSAAPSQPSINGTTPAPGGVPNAPRSGKQLDPAGYFRAEIAAHKQAIALYSKEAASGGDAQLRAYAQHTLPVLKAHLRMAETDLTTELRR